MRITSASTPSAFRSPFLCASRKSRELVPALYASLIFSAASAEVRRREPIRNATNIFFTSYDLPIRNLKSFDSQVPLRLSENREISNFTQSDLAIDLRNTLGVLDESAKSVFRQVSVIVK